MPIPIQISCCQKGPFQVQIGLYLDHFGELVKLSSSYTFNICSYNLLFYIISNIYVCTFQCGVINKSATYGLLNMSYGWPKFDCDSAVNKSPFVSLLFTICNSMFTHLGKIRSILIRGVNRISANML